MINAISPIFHGYVYEDYYQCHVIYYITPIQQSRMSRGGKALCGPRIPKSIIYEVLSPNEVSTAKGIMKFCNTKMSKVSSCWDHFIRRKVPQGII
jgi:hypothetical protein